MLRSQRRADTRGNGAVNPLTDCRGLFIPSDRRPKRVRLQDLLHWVLGGLAFRGRPQRCSNHPRYMLRCCRQCLRVDFVCLKISLSNVHLHSGTLNGDGPKCTMFGSW